MTEPDDLTDRLDALGRAKAPDPDPALLAGLDAARLGRAPQPGPRPRVLRLPVLLPAAAVAAAVLGFVLLAFGGGDVSGRPTTLVIATASDASVQQAERSVPAIEGLTLEEGDRVVTGPAGTVTVGGDTLGPNEEAVLRSGRLRRLRRRIAAARSTTTTVPAPTSPTSPTSVPADAPAPVAPSTPPTTAAATDQRAIPVVLDLVARRRPDGSVALTWSRYGGPDFGGYVVLRQDRDVVARRPSVDGVGAVDRAAPPAATRYVVVVLGADRRPIGRSQVVRV